MGKLLTSLLFLFTYTNLIVAAALENEADLHQSLEGKNGPVCVTPGCVKAAATVLNNLDETIEPCDDFFQFACGGFVKETLIPDDKSSISYFNLIGDRIIEQLRIIVEEPPQPNEPKPFILVKKFYKTCLNTTRIEKDGLQTINKILEKLGGWPAVVGTWNEDQFDWKNTMYEFRKIGLSTSNLLNVYVGSDVQNSSQRIIDIDQASLGLEREYLIEGFTNNVVQAYYDYLVELAVIFGADRDSALGDINESIEFEMKLANISLPKEERRNATLLTNPMTVQELQEGFPSIPWQEYLNKLAGVPDVIVCPYDMVDVGVPKYVTELEKLLKETPKRVQANYLLNQVVINSVTYLTRELRDRELKYESVHDGTPEKEPRWKECAKLAAKKLNLATDAMYVRRYFSDDAKRNAEGLVSNLRNTFIGMLKQVDWMDETTRQTALEKALVMDAHVAYPQELRDDKKLEEYYAELQPSTDSFLKFALDIDKFDTDVMVKELPEPVNKTKWTDHSHVTSVNAYYNSVENSIELPAGILQGVLFDNNRPNYMNYGSIGFAIGHEITHGFDDQGRQYDKDGNLKDWWAQKTNDAFLQKAQCIIDQYSNFTAPEVNMHLNGINTQGENIADNGGVKEAYLAYNLWTKHNGEEPTLPGLNYSQRQLFWISTANLWCAKQRIEYLRQEILIDPHSPPNFRVIGPLSNSDQFAKDFNCPLGSRMNPEHKCRVW